MPDIPNQNLIEEQMASLPDEIKQALASVDWAPKILEIGKKHDLHIDQLGMLQTEIMMVLIGLVPPDEFVSEIRSRLNLPEEKILAIEQDANNMIFGHVRQALVKIFDEELKDVEVEGEANGNPLDKGGLGGLAEEKLTSTFRLPKQETDYSLSKEPSTGSIQNTVEKPTDPYRELPI